MGARALSGLIGLAALSQTALARAHGGGETASVEWLVLALVAVAAALYLRGLRAIWRRASRRGVSSRQALAFAAGLVVLAIVAGGPLETLTSRAFAVHMAQHEALMLVVAPLLVAGRPLATWAWALPRAWRVALRGPLRAKGFVAVWRALTGASGASMLQLALLVAWHVPAMFDAATRDPWLHALQHTCFLASALCFSWAMLRASTMRAGALAAIGWLFVTMVVTSVLGAALTFSPHPWYASYAGNAGALADQQLGGLLMWVPGGLVYVAAALAIGARSLARPARALASAQSLIVRRSA